MSYETETEAECLAADARADAAQAILRWLGGADGTEQSFERMHRILTTIEG